MTSTPRPLSLPPSLTDVPTGSRVARIPLVTRMHVPGLSYTTFDGEKRNVSFGSGQPVLINLWASWCAPCVAELAEMTRHENDLRGAGIEVVALSVDGLGEDSADVAQAKAILTQIGFSFHAGHAAEDLIGDLQDYHDHVVPMWRPLPIPTSFLIDGQSRLAVIYTGPVSVDDVLADARHLTGDYVQRFERAACLPGRALDHPQVAAAARAAETRTRYRVAAGFHAAGRLADAAACFLDLLEFDPVCKEAHSQLAVIFLRREDLLQAAVHCRRALELDPENARQHNTMGNILSGQQKLAQAEAQYARAIQIDPDYAEAHNNLGTVYASRGNFAKAADHFKRAIAIEPNSAAAHNNLGSVFAASGDLSTAAGHYQEAIRADPKYAEAYNNLGSMFARQGDLKRAAAQYRRALEINPTYREARDNLKRAELSLESQQDAR
jgi:Tfp pilus assembly protein PilF/thiol-disulfide isomerase/thioredoxin